MMKRSKALELNLPILARFVCATAIGCDPDIMGIGPALAIPKALKLAGLTVADVDLFEVNEAFASQALYSCRVLNLPMEKVNVNGGAIAIGHPLGCTGARQIATGLSELRRSNKKVLVTSMCVGVSVRVAIGYTLTTDWYGCCFSHHCRLDLHCLLSLGLVALYNPLFCPSESVPSASTHDGRGIEPGTSHCLPCLKL